MANQDSDHSTLTEIKFDGKVEPLEIPHNPLSEEEYQELMKLWVSIKPNSEDYIKDSNRWLDLYSRYILHGYDNQVVSEFKGLQPRYQK